jgi:hypothetical protein
MFCYCCRRFRIRSTIGNKPSEVLVQTGVIGRDGRWPLAAPLLFVSKPAVYGGVVDGNNN